MIKTVLAGIRFPVTQQHHALEAEPYRGIEDEPQIRNQKSQPPQVPSPIRGYNPTLGTRYHTNYTYPPHLHDPKGQELQIVSHPQEPTSTPSGDHQPIIRQIPTHPLVVSPYTSLEHLLDPSTLTTSQTLLTLALSDLAAITPAYATTPYHLAFNWPTIISNLRDSCTTYTHTWQHQYFYIVVFRSRIPPTTSRAHLGQLDELSHVEATKSGGLLKYWFGEPDTEGRNLATCKFYQFLPPSVFFLSKKKKNT